MDIFPLNLELSLHHPLGAPKLFALTVDLFRGSLRGLLHSGSRGTTTGSRWTLLERLSWTTRPLRSGSTRLTTNGSTGSGCWASLLLTSSSLRLVIAPPDSMIFGTLPLSGDRWQVLRGTHDYRGDRWLNLRLSLLLLRGSLRFSNLDRLLYRRLGGFWRLFYRFLNDFGLWSNFNHPFFNHNNSFFLTGLLSLLLYFGGLNS